MDGVALNAVVERLHNAYHAAKGRGLVRRDKLARDFWAEVYPDLTCGREGIKGALCSRADAHVLRLSLLYALLDSSEAIRIEHLHAALAVWRFCERSVADIFGNQSGDADADRILRALASGPLTLSELHRVFSNNKTTDWLLAKLSMMVRKKQIVPTLKECNRKRSRHGKLLKITNRDSSSFVVS